jgi:hypothetical protein
MAATAYYTDAYNKAILPDKDVPAGMLLAQATTYTSATASYAGDTIYMLKLPAGAVLVYMLMSCTAGGGSGTLSVGTVTVSTGATVSATNIFGAFSSVGAGNRSLAGGTQGSTAIATAVGTVGVGTKFTVATGLLVTNAATAHPADGTISMAAVYYMDYGGDLAYDPG